MHTLDLLQLARQFLPAVVVPLMRDFFSFAVPAACLSTQIIFVSDTKVFGAVWRTRCLYLTYELTCNNCCYWHHRMFESEGNQTKTQICLIWL